MTEGGKGERVRVALEDGNHPATTSAVIAMLEIQISGFVNSRKECNANSNIVNAQKKPSFQMYLVTNDKCMQICHTTCPYSSKLLY